MIINTAKITHFYHLGHIQVILHLRATCMNSGPSLRRQRLETAGENDLQQQQQAQYTAHGERGLRHIGETAAGYGCYNQRQHELPQIECYRQQWHHCGGCRPAALDARNRIQKRHADTRRHTRKNTAGKQYG